jgi:hypothetical protein
MVHVLGWWCLGFVGWVEGEAMAHVLCWWCLGFVEGTEAEGKCLAARGRRRPGRPDESTWGSHRRVAPSG